MNLTKYSLILDMFTCPVYQHNEAKIPFKMCMGRQIQTTPGGGALYPECKACKSGQKITKHFKNYTPNNPVKPANFGTFINKKKKRAKKGTSPYSCHYQGGGSVVVTANKDLKTIIMAQIPYILKLVSENKIKQAIDRIRLLNKEIG